MASAGLVRAGYTYLNIDDIWAADQRDAAGAITADPAKFPSGEYVCCLLAQSINRSRELLYRL